eukprot:GILK01012631.1.p1 GENE.GILK01012631.1~~GILK01012631.1.p1  ORF type:complete len:208 (-),score=6.39 GILK01012631.1:150-773(-)
MADDDLEFTPSFSPPTTHPPKQFSTDAKKGITIRIGRHESTPSAASTPASVPATPTTKTQPPAEVTLDLLGYKYMAPIEHATVFCPSCDLPIILRCRVIPCNHLMCMTCAKQSTPRCLSCSVATTDMEPIAEGDAVFICHFPQCRRAFLTDVSFTEHQQAVHPEFFAAIAERLARNEFPMPAPFNPPTQNESYAYPYQAGRGKGGSR